MPAETTIDTSLIVGAVQRATESVFSMMLNLPAEVQPHQIVPQPEPVDGVVALVGFAGPWPVPGFFSVTSISLARWDQPC